MWLSVDEFTEGLSDIMPLGTNFICMEWDNITRVLKAIR